MILPCMDIYFSCLIIVFFTLNVVSHFFVNIEENEFGLKFNFYLLRHV